MAFSSEKVYFHSKNAFLLNFLAEFFQKFANFGALSNWIFEKLGLEEITEIVDLVKRFPMSIWLQKSASIQTRTSLLKFEDRRFCRTQLADQMPSLL